MSGAVLVVNSGSSSMKLGLFDISASEPVLLCKGVLDEHEAQGRFSISDGKGKPLTEKRQLISDEGHILLHVFAWIKAFLGGTPLRAVGHRVVHGGVQFAEPVDVTPDVFEQLEALTPLAPLHQPRCLAPIRDIRALRPDMRQIGCFDTAFHRSLAPVASRFAIPQRFEQQGLRRYGFHGLSFEYIAGRLAELSPELKAKRTVVAHLGNGASLCALRDGMSVDTTMGFSPLDGLVMGTRCGAIDPGVLLYLLQHERLSAPEIEQLLYHDSGLLGLSGISADMRTLLASKEASAAEAVDLFVVRATQQIAMMVASLGGLECLVFTAGIGEHSAEIRKRICERLGWLGVEMNDSENAAGSYDIGKATSQVAILVIPTNEELIIARQCAVLMGVNTAG